MVPYKALPNATSIFAKEKKRKRKKKKKKKKKKNKNKDVTDSMMHGGKVFLFRPI
jgi:hypothetical protein